MKRKRTEDVDIEFENGCAKDWAFDVSEEFRPALDIAYMQRADKKANAALKAKLGRPLLETEKTWRLVWTRGEPPAYAFNEGDIFYDPAGLRAMNWDEALPLLRRTVKIIQANPDLGALPPISNEENTAIQDLEQLEQPEPGKGSGWVKYRVFYYEKGEIVKQDVHDLRQCEFAEFLRTGIS